jgi:AcrR family transcriptional regulator
MTRIAAASGVTKLILYRHFDSKAALYRAVLSRELERLAGKWLAGLEVEGFVTGARSLLNAAQEDPDAFRLLWRHASREPEFAEYADALRMQAVSALRASLGDRVPAESLKWAAHAVVGYLVEAVLNWLEFGEPTRDEQFVRATNQALRAGVRAWTEASGEERGTRPASHASGGLSGARGRREAKRR